MAELPEIVRQRLAQQPGGDHPDPDLLAAFAEGALTARERTQVLAHLGACAACREVVSLALPQTPAPQPAPAPVPSAWLRWPVLRWGAVAAAMVIVAAAVMLRMPSRKSLGVEERSIAQAPKPEQSVPASAAPETEAKNTALGAITPPQLEKKGTASRADYKEDAKHKLAPRLEGGIQAGAIQADAYQAPAEDVVRKSASPATQTSGGPQNAPAQVHQKPGGATQQFRQQNVTAAERAAPVRAGAAPLGVQGQSQVFAQQAMPAPKAAPAKDSAAMAQTQLRRLSAAPRWRVSSDGNLERSADSGATWRIVTVGQPAKFRAVSAMGDDVWAAGAAGALFHSSDAGQTWTRVFPRSGEAALASDILRVEFTDPRHGLVVTASGETWATADGGRTWALRHN